MEPLSLACVATSTPSHWDIRIVDEVVEDIPEDYQPDLVGITSMTLTTARAYEIARRYREQGVTVVMGGVHANLQPDEAQQHVDAVFLGEAEGAWSRLLGDFETGRLERRYNGQAAELRGLPWPRRDLYRRRYFLQLVTASRGCKYRCDFCSLWKMEGGRYRARPPEEFFDELEATAKLGFPQSWSMRPLFFTDENVYTDRDWALSLFRGMADRGLRRPFAVQASVNIADDDEVLAALKSSGCVSVLIGFESISEESLRALRKGVNLKTGVSHFKEKVARLHDHGLVSSGTFMFGSDGDGLDIFERTAEFVVEAGVDVAHFGLLTPYPGTDLYDRLVREDRMIYNDFPADYARYDLCTAVFRPAKMTPEQLEEGLVWTAHAVGSRRAAARRAWGTWRVSKHPFLTALIYRWNRSGLYDRVVR